MNRFAISKIIFRSTEQQHQFNFPFQLGPESRDKPEMADITKTATQQGDLVIAATDGFFDNMFDSDVTSVLTSQLAGKATTDLQGHALTDLARVLAEAARQRAHGRDPTPWSEHAAKAGYRTRGGKPDDITVVVATVQPSEVAQISGLQRAASAKL